MNGYIHRQTDLTEILGLRHRVLREGFPLDDARFDGDNDSSTLHMATYACDEQKSRTGPPLCCATFMDRMFMQKTRALQLRGMATEPAFQGKGLGKALLLSVIPEIVYLSGIRWFWCNARLSAVPFYEKLGWVCKTAVFEIPTVGPHRVMLKIQE